MANSASKSTGFFAQLEENLIAIILGLMTLITFANVVARYGFNSNILWALELTSILFAWLVVLGASYCVKINAHLGVDAVVSLLSSPMRRALTFAAALACVLYAVFLFKGGWDFWANFANLPGTSGRWFPTGFDEKYLAKGWYEAEDIYMPQSLQIFADWFNEGERYEKIPLMIPYIIMPIGMALLLFRFVQSAMNVWRGKRGLIIVSHEVEDAIEEMAQANKQAQDKS